MEMEKIFWAIVLVAVGGFFIFLTLGSSAPSAANPATQQAGGDAVAAPLAINRHSRARHQSPKPRFRRCPSQCRMISTSLIRSR